MKRFCLSALAALAALGLGAGCATIYHHDAKEGADVIFEYKQFPESKIGKHPYIDRLDGKLVTGGYFRKSFKLVPGKHKAVVKQQAALAGYWTGEFEFEIPGPGNWTVVVSKGETISKLMYTFKPGVEVVARQP